MITQKSISLRSIDYLLSLSPKHFSGRLDIANSEKHQWSIYFDKGRIDWATGGVHPRRRWRRNLMKYCPNVSVDSVIPLENNVEDARFYTLLTVLLKQKEISEAQVVAITKSTVAEVIFDLIQEQELGDENDSVFYTCDGRDVLKQPIMRVSVYEVLEEVQQQWEGWRKAKLTNYSPNLAPVLKQPRKLQQQVSATVYKKLKTAMSKGLTLRDLAVYLKQDLLRLTNYLMPYIHQGTIELVEVADLANPLMAKAKKGQKQEAIANSQKKATKRGINKTASQKPPALNKPDLGKAPLIVCIDDCPLTQKLLKEIVTTAGYRFFGIQEAVMAMPALIEQKPDLILLDLVMPIANGYEICTQIRRVSQLKNVPVVILTGRDGLVDRVRATIVGCSDFIAKPVEAEKVLKVIEKYLGCISTMKQSNN